MLESKQNETVFIVELLFAKSVCDKFRICDKCNTMLSRIVALRRQLGLPISTATADPRPAQERPSCEVVVWLPNGTSSTHSVPDAYKPLILCLVNEKPIRNFAAALKSGQYPTLQTLLIKTVCRLIEMEVKALCGDGKNKSNFHGKDSKTLQLEGLDRAREHNSSSSGPAPSFVI